MKLNMLVKFMPIFDAKFFRADSADLPNSGKIPLLAAQRER